MAQPVAATCPTCGGIVAFTLESDSAAQPEQWAHRGLTVTTLDSDDGRTLRVEGHAPGCDWATTNDPTGPRRPPSTNQAATRHQPEAALGDRR